MTRLRWTTGERLTPIHAARCFALGIRGVDAVIVKGIEAPMAELSSRLAAAEIDFGLFWQRLIRDAASGESDLDACSAALISAGCSPLSVDSTASAIASQLADIRLVHQERFPKLAEQISLRGRPLREQWDGYGAGLLKRISKLTHPSFVPKSVTCLLLAPYRGGEGGQDSSALRIWIEAVLTNPFPEVPEVLRLVWLISQVGLIEGLSSGTEDSQGDPWVSPPHLPRVAALATMPLTLEAASYLELIPTSPQSLPSLFEKTAHAWRISVDGPTLEILESWWRQFQDLQTPPAVTLKALDRMLHPEPETKPGTRR
jgi:hypothetical protein